MPAYIYKLKNKRTNQIYIGTQYKSSARKEDFWIKYFTSCNTVIQNIQDYEVLYVKERADARDYEAKLLQRIYRLYGKEYFLKKMINRNLAPGIIHDTDSKREMSRRMKNRWKSGEMFLHHAKAISTKRTRIYNPPHLTVEEKERRSSRMKNNNPMHSAESRARHKERMNDPDVKQRRVEKMKNKAYTKGKSWYNNSIESKMFFDPPEGWVKGRLNPHWNYSRKGK